MSKDLPFLCPRRWGSRKQCHCSTSFTEEDGKTIFLGHIDNVSLHENYYIQHFPLPPLEINTSKMDYNRCTPTQFLGTTHCNKHKFEPALQQQEPLIQSCQRQYFKGCPQQTLLASKEGAACSSPAAWGRQVFRTSEAQWLQPCSACHLDFKVDRRGACTFLQTSELWVQCRSPGAGKATEVSLTDRWPTPNSSCFHTWLQQLLDIPLKYFNVLSQ